ncbi:MAG: hypothetical protein ACM3Z4_19110, partial [Hyphomicrobiales bacterium]
LNRLRDLPDTPTPTEPSATVSPAEQPKVAGLPADRLDSDPGEPAAATETPSVSIPVEIGEPSATELPVAPKETTSATEKPEQAKPQRENPAPRTPAASRQNGIRRDIAASIQSFRGVVRRSAISLPAAGLQRPVGSGRQYQQPTYGTQQPAQGQYQQPAYGNQQATPQTPVEPYPMSRQHIY